MSSSVDVGRLPNSDPEVAAKTRETPARIPLRNINNRSRKGGNLCWTAAVRCVGPAPVWCHDFLIPRNSQWNEEHPDPQKNRGTADGTVEGGRLKNKVPRTKTPHTQLEALRLGVSTEGPRLGCPQRALDLNPYRVSLRMRTPKHTYCTYCAPVHPHQARLFDPIKVDSGVVLFLFDGSCKLRCACFCNTCQKFNKQLQTR